MSSSEDSIIEEIHKLQEELCEKIVQEWESFTPDFPQNFVFLMKKP